MPDRPKLSVTRRVRGTVTTAAGAPASPLRVHDEEDHEYEDEDYADDGANLSSDGKPARV